MAPLTPKPPHLHIRLLGELAVLRDGESVPLPASKKTRALLAYLATTRAPQPRQRLCDLLWDGPDDPRAGLRWSLTKLRAVVDDEKTIRLVANRERASFEATANVTIDLFEATRLLAVPLPTLGDAAIITEALSFLKGDFLEGLDLPDCYRFHEWCTAERERARALRLSALETLITRLEKSAPEQALVHARERLAIDPLSDVAHASVIKILAHLDRAPEARAQVETCQRILDRELGGRRSTALDLARMEIGKGSGVVTTTAVTPATARVTTTTTTTPRQQASVLVGREREMSAILSELTLVAGRSTVLVTGEPGIGKSRVIAEVQARLQKDAALSSRCLLTARAFEAEAVRPYGIWIDVLRTEPARSLAFKDHHARDLAPLLPELFAERPAPTTHDPETKARLFDGVARLLQELQHLENTGLVLLIIDDVHWLDEASLSLLHYVLRVTNGLPIRVLCGARDGELADNPAALRLLRSLRRDEQLLQVMLEPLTEEETRLLCLNAGFAPSSSSAPLYRESGGNPLFAIEAARAHSTNGGATTALNLDALLEERFARMSDRAKDTVVWASALGRSFDPQLLAVVTCEPLAQLIGSLGELERDNVIQVTSNGSSYVFAHELLRKAAYKQLSGPRRKLVHRTIALALRDAAAAAAAEQKTNAETASSGDVVHHATLADDHELIATSCVTAGLQCLRMFARRQALDFALRGIAKTSPLAGASLRTRVELLRIAGFSAAADPERMASLAVMASDAAAVARDAGEAEIAGIALFVLSYLHHAREDFERAHTTTIDAETAARAAADPVASLPAIANTALCLTLIERELPKARALLDEAAELARTHRLTVCDVELGAGVLAHFEGDLVQASAALTRGLAIARANRDAWRESVAVSQLAMMAAERSTSTAGRSEEVKALAADLHAIAKKLGEGSEGATATALDALAGYPSSTNASEMSAALEALENADAKNMLAFVLTRIAEIDLELGQSASAYATATRALQTATPMKKTSALVLARILLARSKPAEAGEHLAAIKTLINHPYGISRRARDAVARIPTLRSTLIPTVVA